MDGQEELFTAYANANNNEQNRNCCAGLLEHITRRYARLEAILFGGELGLA